MANQNHWKAVYVNWFWYKCQTVINSQWRLNIQKLEQKKLVTHDGFLSFFLLKCSQEEFLSSPCILGKEVVVITIILQFFFTPERNLIKCINENPQQLWYSGDRYGILDSCFVLYRKCIIDFFDDYLNEIWECSF